MTEEHNTPGYRVASITTTGPWGPSFVTISQYNELLSLYFDRGKEIARLQAVVRNAIHSLRARRDVAGTLPPCDEMLLEELEAALEGKE